MSAQDRRLAAIGEAAAEVLRRTDYHLVRAEDVAAAVRLSREGQSGRRSAVWLYNEVKSRRVLVSLALRHAFARFAERHVVPERPPAPGSLVEARDLVTEALLLVARFHRAESFLTQQVQLGIGDIATSEKRQSGPAGPPAWPDTVMGRVAAAGWAGRMVAYADHLAPAIAAATEAVCPAPPGWVTTCADRLSDLAFDALSDDPDGPVDRQAAALGAHWYERHLVPLAGTWLGDLDVAERARDVALRSGEDTTAEAAAQDQVLRALLGTGVLMARAAREAARLCRLLDGPPAAAPRARCEALGRHGLALLRFGDADGARRSFAAGLQIAEEIAAGDPENASCLARAWHNLGEALVEAGRPVEGARLLEQARTARATDADPGGASHGWRRHTLTELAAARAATRCGRVTDGLRLAERVAADRRARLGDPGDINVVAARVALGEALLAAGQPVEARHVLQEAARRRAEVLRPDAYWPNHDVVRAAQAELVLRDPAAAARMLERAPVLSDWFGREVSFRLWGEARVAHALAMAMDDDVPAALGALAELDALLAGAPADALARSARRALAEVRLRDGDPAGAAALLASVAAAEEGGGDPPGRARTLLLAARCAEARGDGAAAEAARAALAGVELDPRHPLLLAARYDQAARCFAAGRPEGLDGLLDPLLDRTPLAHGRPALGDGHPLLLKALALADRSGTVRQPHAARPVLWEDA
ncbi:hypothetical protein Sru01_37930 [Sphaerisporangium rufum]|uniref:Tetratricopeptide repeat-containing protein n=1 Tax=Sphaerisporangium rufum TaxID=1381558 RepID=A0A919R5K5_9ACTN|nr:hypothetical protein [Sphaerisporangium rufum]GII78811.1 hypothetical protein Sru01_37930 [Sphaerisporangium rufum]